eukprot:TRINITY_DN27038_c0_g1_i1.p1 TRINITY_DN27038_c0_g1~~TRINITY_DN27038_c0_g1_i1.p1  ORF type:complete len:621 (+),score=85.04 TRINITY_DN27038_c0_g1_i1:97-1959(+)
MDRKLRRGSTTTCWCFLAAAIVLLSSSYTLSWAFAAQPRFSQARRSPTALAARPTLTLDRVTNEVATQTTGPEKTVIVGGGPAGLATAISLARRGYTNIHVYDRLQEPPDPDNSVLWSDTARFYLIGLGGRGQKALKELDVWDDVKKYAVGVVGRKDWPPGASPDEGVERIFTDRPYVTEVLARDRLVGVLLRAVRERYGHAITPQYGVECNAVSWDSDAAGTDIAKLQLQRCGSSSDAAAVRSLLLDEPEACDVDGEPFEETTELLIGADGATRAIADAMEELEKQKGVEGGFHVTRYDDDNARVYKTVPLKMPKGWRGDINYSSRSKDGRVVFDALPADEHGNYCGVLLLRESDPLAKPDTSPEELRALLEEYVPQFSSLVAAAEVEKIAQRPPSRLPKFRFVGPNLHLGSSTVLLGDAIHTVKPYFGLGANSALEDVSILSRTLDAAGDALSPALSNFTSIRAPEAAALVRISRALDRPGLLGFFTFVLPLILDVVFNKVVPSVFAPNTIAMLQRDGLTFCDVARRKRKDRILQLLLLGAGLTGAVKVSSWVFQTGLSLARLAPGRFVGAVAAATGAAALLAFGRGAAASRHMAPADVLAKAGGDVVSLDHNSRQNK